MIHGTDVSSYQPEQFPLELPDGTPIEFVMIKVTQGAAYTNPKWKAQAAWARQHGLAVGFYHFGEAGDQKVHAGRFLGVLGALYPGETLWYDWEGGATAPTNAEKDAFILEVKRQRPGRKVGLYCNVDFWKNRDTTNYHGDALWIASWAAGEPPIEASWTVHQYSDGGGKADHNRAKFSSSEEMKVWGGKPEDATVTLLRALLDAQQERILALQTDFTALASGVRALVNHADVQASLASSRFDALKSTLDIVQVDVAELTPDPAPTAADVINELARRLES